MTVEEKLEIQVKIARNCKTQCKEIKNKLGTLNNLMKELDHSFKNGQEKYYIYSRLNTCGSNIAKVGNTYDAFADNVLQLSEQMKKFLTFSGIMDGKNPIKYNPVDCRKSSSTKAVINTTSTRVCANKIVALGSDLYDINLNLGAAIKNVDETLMKAITRKYGSIAKLNKQLDQYSNAIKAVGQDLLVICDNYEKSEKNLQKRLREITEGKNLTYGCGSATEDTKKIYGFTESVKSFGKISYSVFGNGKTHDYVKDGNSYYVLNNMERFSGAKYSQNRPEYSGQEIYSYGCGACSVAIIKAITSGSDKNPKDYYVNGTGTIMGNYGNVMSVKGSESALKQAYELLNKGIPTVAQLNGPFNKKTGKYDGQHFVAIVGIKSGADVNNLTVDDFLAIDPVGGTIKSLKDCYSSVGGVSKDKVSLTSVRWYL